jgi:hypothetical protein
VVTGKCGEHSPWTGPCEKSLTGGGKEDPATPTSRGLLNKYSVSRGTISLGGGGERGKSTSIRCVVTSNKDPPSLSPRDT